MDGGGADEIFDPVRDNKIVNPPAGVVFSGIKTIAPPTVNAGCIRIQKAEGIGKAGRQQYAKTVPFFIGETGTAIFAKQKPLSVACGIGIPELDTEGRLITLEYPDFYLVTCYTPNAQQGLARIDHRLKWDEAFRAHLSQLDQKKPVIACGDLNVAHQEIDLKNPSSNRGNAGFSDEERSSFSTLLDAGFTDTFRFRNPEATGIYSWWSYRFNARKNNAGWRIDYFLVSNRLADRIEAAAIHPDIMGSDHCPVSLTLSEKSC